MPQACHKPFLSTLSVSGELAFINSADRERIRICYVSPSGLFGCKFLTGKIRSDIPSYLFKGYTLRLSISNPSASVM
ncbi:hypothetical protein LENED_010313 [Lentinula edodes]|uniref:Uncharacterized protein n=1 Tax=Lentinula edodes TaxID=5353 RepID=A0A1Q3EM60_LENED|nr:hypothetical protein LENED_010313 [Lentinula edodes]